MSSLTTLARPYAKAAFDLASGQDGLSEWHKALAAAAAVTSDETMAGWLKSPDLDREKVVQIISEAAGGDEGFARFLSVLAANNRLSLLPEVTTMFSRLKDAAENQLNVRVVSAIALDEDQSTRMSAALAKRFDCSIDLENEVDGSVLGGAVIYAGDEVIDGSLRGRLAKLESSLA